MPKYAKKKDATQPEIEEELERLGIEYIDTSGYPGFVDLIFSRNGNHLVECKSKGGSLRPGQKDLAKRWPEPIYVIRSAMEIRALVQQLDREDRLPF